MRTRRILSLLAASAIALTACAGGTETADETDSTGETGTDTSTDAGPLVVYSGRSDSLIGPLVERYEQETGVEVEVKYDDTANLALLLATEGDATPADVFLAQSPGAVGFAAGKGVLGTLDADTLSQVDERWRAADGSWIGVTLRVRTLVYNTDEVDAADLPASVDDLTDEAYRGRFGVAPTNGSFQDFVTAMRLERGDEATLEWLEGIAANEPGIYPKNSAIVDAVARGEIEMGLVNHYYNLRHLAENPEAPSTNHFFSNDIGSFAMVSTASVTATSTHPQAQAFVAWLLGQDAQEYFRSETFEYPLSGGLQPAEGLPSLADLQLPDINVAELDDLETTTDLIRESGLTS